MLLIPTDVFKQAMDVVLLGATVWQEPLSERKLNQEIFPPGGDLVASHAVREQLLPWLC